MSKIFLRIVAASVFAIGAYELIKRLLDNSEKGDEYRPKKETLLVERFSVSDIVEWFDKHEGMICEDSVRIVSTVTEKNMKMFTFSKLSKKIEPDKYMILSIVDKSVSLPKVYCLVNFGLLDDSVKELMNNKEYIILED